MFETHTAFMLPVRRDTTKLGITERTLAVLCADPGFSTIRTPGLVPVVALLLVRTCVIRRALSVAVCRSWQVNGAPNDR